jgi:hypothetical protein
VKEISEMITDERNGTQFVFLENLKTPLFDNQPHMNTDCKTGLISAS